MANILTSSDHRSCHLSSSSLILFSCSYILHFDHILANILSSSDYRSCHQSCSSLILFFCSYILHFEHVLANILSSSDHRSCHLSSSKPILFSSTYSLHCIENVLATLKYRTQELAPEQIKLKTIFRTHILIAFNMNWLAYSHEAYSSPKTKSFLSECICAVLNMHDDICSGKLYGPHKYRSKMALLYRAAIWNN